MRSFEKNLCEIKGILWLIAALLVASYFKSETLSVFFLILAVLCFNDSMKNSRQSKKKKLADNISHCFYKEAELEIISVDKDCITVKKPKFLNSFPDHITVKNEVFVFDSSIDNDTAKYLFSKKEN